MTRPTVIKIGPYELKSRLIVGTGKYPDNATMVKALEISGADMVTVAVRRINLDRTKESMLDFIDSKKYILLPNTAGCYTADEAIRTAHLAREALDTPCSIHGLFVSGEKRMALRTDVHHVRPARRVRLDLVPAGAAHRRRSAPERRDGDRLIQPGQAPVPADHA